MWKLAILLSAGLTLSACASTEGGEQSNLVTRDKIPPSNGECIFSRSLNDWRYVDRYTIIAWGASRARPYTVEFTGPCSDLNFQETLAVDTGRDGRICDYGGDAVLTRFGRCSIARITKITPEEADKLLGREPKEEEAEQAPAEG